MIDLRIISIGALDAHPFWNERASVRTGHATTSMIRTGDAVILVDPALPAQIITARLAERTGLEPSAITHVFLTSFRPDVRRGLEAFEQATWWIGQTERESVGVPLARQLQHAADEGEGELRDALESEVALLQRCEAAPDELAKGISLFPLPGVTPGLTGLLLADQRHTTLICGDAIPTLEHLEEGQAPKTAIDVAQARESFGEAVEIADLLVLGRDNLVLNPTKRPF